VSVYVTRASGDSAQLFLDLYNAGDSSEAPDHLVSADSGESGIDIEVDREADYLVRLQPELLRSTRYTLTIRTAPTLAFPVDGVGNEAIRSGWGADRDGGRRRHEGIDIFAPRGTPVVAAAPGRIVEVGENRLGGLVVWLWDPERNQNIYYAHLDRQIAVEGESVDRGDTLGLVGNSGNARTTQPHLHFGIYRRGEGPIDPHAFVYRTVPRAPAIESDTGRVGEWVRVAGRRLVFNGSPAPFSQLGDTLERATLMRVAAASGASYRVVFPDGGAGFVQERSVEPAVIPIRQSVLDSAGWLLDFPGPAGIPIESLPVGFRVQIVGRFGDFDLTRTGEGRLGWIRTR
jgi:peptidoglycan LD-endopeptidase LytH